MTINGIDVSDPKRDFTGDEWGALGQNGGRAYVMQARSRINGRGGGRGRGRGRGGRRVHFEERNIGAVSHNVGNQQGREPSDGLNGDRSGRNRRGFGRGAYSRDGV